MFPANTGQGPACSGSALACVVQEQCWCPAGLGTCFAPVSERFANICPNQPKPGLYVNTVHRTATRNVLNTLRNVQPVHPNSRTRLVRSPFNRTREKTLSGVDLSPRLRNSCRIHMARFSGPGDHSGPISGHFRRFGDLGRTHYLRLQHWHSTLTPNIDIQVDDSTSTFNVDVQHWH